MRPPLADRVGIAARTGEMIVRLAAGGHEALSGRFIHADPVLG
ncbi:MAG TPA: hypothetical protein VJ206_06810 [bacterium]|nr:hypothetical protein [bacterium]